MATTLAQRLARLVRKHGRKKLIEASGIAAKTFDNWKAGVTTNPGLEKLKPLADAAGVSLEWLATGEGPAVLVRSADADGGAGMVRSSAELIRAACELFAQSVRQCAVRDALPPEARINAWMAEALQALRERYDDFDLENEPADDEPPGPDD